MSADRPADEPTEADPALLRPGQRIRHRDGDEYILVERKTGSHAEPLPGWWLRQVGHEYQVGLADANWESGEWSLVDGQPTEADPLAGLEHIGDYDFGRACFWSIHEDLSPQYRRDHGMVPLYRIVDRRALVGGRSAAPTREQIDAKAIRWANQFARKASDAGTHFTEEGVLTLAESFADAVVALLSRPAEPPEGERTLAEARSLMRTARSLDPTKPASNELLGQVFGDLIELLAPDGVAAEPNEETESDG